MQAKIIRGATKSNIPSYGEKLSSWIKPYIKQYSEEYYDYNTLSRCQLVRVYELVQLLNRQLQWVTDLFNKYKNKMSADMLLSIAEEISMILMRIENINNGRY